MTTSLPFSLHTHRACRGTETSARRLRPSREISHASSPPSRPMSRLEADARYANSKHGSARWCALPSAASARTLKSRRSIIHAGRSFELASLSWISWLDWKNLCGPRSGRIQIACVDEGESSTRPTRLRNSGNSCKRARKKNSIPRLRRRVIR